MSMHGWNGWNVSFYIPPPFKLGQKFVWYIYIFFFFWDSLLYVYKVKKLTVVVGASFFFLNDVVWLQRLIPLAQCFWLVNNIILVSSIQVVKRDTGKLLPHPLIFFQKSWEIYTMEVYTYGGTACSILLKTSTQLQRYINFSFSGHLFF